MTKLEPRELNKRLAQALKMDLGAKTNNDRIVALGLWWDQCDPVYGAMIGMTSLLTVWRNRQGNPYQQEIEDWVAAWQREPPDWAGDIAVAIELGLEIHKRGYVEGQGLLWMTFTEQLRTIVSKRERIMPLFCGIQSEFLVAHASAYDRACAALLALGGTLD